MGAAPGPNSFSRFLCASCCTHILRGFFLSRSCCVFPHGNVSPCQLFSLLFRSAVFVLSPAASPRDFRVPTKNRNPWVPRASEIPDLVTEIREVQDAGESYVSRMTSDSPVGVTALGPFEHTSRRASELSGGCAISEPDEIHVLRGREAHVFNTLNGYARLQRFRS